MAAPIDPITAQVIGGRLYQSCLEAAGKLGRMSFSNIIRESEDYGVVLTDAECRQLSEVNTTPLQMGTLPGYARGVKRLVAERGHTIEPGDVFIHNDPYNGASHNADVGIVVPVFYHDELVGYVICAAHHLDVGSSKPGSSSVDAVDAYAEGVRLRAVKLYERGHKNQQAWILLNDNVRMSQMVVGDMEAQIAACHIAEQRFQQTLDSFGKERVTAATHWLADYSERMLRQEIARLPDGTYRAEGYCDGYLDSDDPSRRDIKLAVSLTIKGSDLQIDLTGTSPQVDDRPINMPFEGTVKASIMIVVRTLLLDEAIYGFIPQNDGIWRPITITAPLGSIANPRFPAPTIARAMTAWALSNVVVRAFAQAAPERCCAGCGTTSLYVFAGINPQGIHWVHLDIYGGAYGATSTGDGFDAIDCLFANTRNVPIEDIEMHYPLRYRTLELRGRPAAGKFRGGVAARHDIQMLTPSWLSAESDGHTYPNWGFQGAREGRVAEMWLNPDADSAVKLPSKFTGVAVRGGSIARYDGACGGGWGDPQERDPERVLADYLDGLISVEEARQDYGVVIDSQRKTVSLEETQRLRSQVRAGRVPA